MPGDGDVSADRGGRSESPPSALESLSLGGRVPLLLGLLGLEASGLLLGPRLRGHGAGGAVVLGLLLAESAARQRAPLGAGKAGRDLSLDVLRGAVMQHVMVFHVAYDLRALGVLPACQAALPKGAWGLAGTTADKILYIVVLVVGHAVVIAVGLRNNRAGETLLTLFSWFVVTTWTLRSRLTGFCLMCCVAGYTSAHQFERAGPAVGPFLRRAARRAALLGAVAAALSLIAYLARGAQGAGFLGAPHILALGGLCHLPFLYARRLALLVGGLACCLYVLGHLPDVPCSSRALDCQPTVGGLAAYTLGVGLYSARAQVFLARRLCPPGHHDSVFAWVGQRALLLYASHQAVVFPLAYAVRLAFGPRRPGRLPWCWRA